MSAPAVEATPARRNLYARLWIGLPRELGFLALTLPLATIGFSLTVSMFSGGIGTLVTFFIGVVVLIAALYISRGFGTLVLVRLSWAGRPPITRPEWVAAKPGFWAWLRSVLFNGHYWLYLLHTMIIDFAVSLFSWIVSVVWVSVGLGGISYWFWSLFLPRPDLQWYLSRKLSEGGGMGGVNAQYQVDDNILYLVGGIVLLATLPFITRGLVMMHNGIAYALLGAWKSEALQRRVDDLSESRGAAISAEGHSLRRLERDIHDGPQQRLVRLQMDLAAADRQLGDDPEKARGLIAEAMQQSKDALEELRALSRGFAPPILLDRGLVAALESAATRSTIPTRVVDDLPEGTELPQEIERNAYFVASEALTNAIKHSGATDIELRVGLRTVGATAAGAAATWLDVAVTDNGTGGAETTAGHGIAGLAERLRGLGGTLEVTSPAGGPTVVTAALPVVTPANG